MKFSLVIFLLSFALMASGQAKQKAAPPPQKNMDSVRKAHADSLQRADAQRRTPSLARAKPKPKATAADPNLPKAYYLILPAKDWAQLLQLLDLSKGPHDQVKAFTDYIQQNAKEVPTIPVASDSTGK